MKIEPSLILTVFTLSAGALSAQTTLYVDNFDNGDMGSSGNADWFNRGISAMRWTESGTTVKSQADATNFAFTSLNSKQTFSMPGPGETVTFEFDFAGASIVNAISGNDARVYFRLVDVDGQSDRAINFKADFANRNIGMRGFLNDTNSNVFTQGFHDATDGSGSQTIGGGTGIAWDFENDGLTWAIEVTETGYSMSAGGTVVHSDTFADAGFVDPFDNGMYPVLSYGNLGNPTATGFIEANSFTVTSVPEPAQLSILSGLIVLSLALIRRKRI